MSILTEIQRFLTAVVNKVSALPSDMVPITGKIGESAFTFRTAAPVQIMNAAFSFSDATTLENQYLSDAVGGNTDIRYYFRNNTNTLRRFDPPSTFSNVGTVANPYLVYPNSAIYSPWNDAGYFVDTGLNLIAIDNTVDP